MTEKAEKLYEKLTRRFAEMDEPCADQDIINILEDGTYWQGSDVDPAVLEELHVAMAAA